MNIICTSLRGQYWCLVSHTHIYLHLRALIYRKHNTYFAMRQQKLLHIALFYWKILINHPYDIYRATYADYHVDNKLNKYLKITDIFNNVFRPQ